MAFDLLSCSWPRPVQQTDGRWVSDPEWDAPLMPQLPQAQARTIDGQHCWSLNWCQIFSQGLRFHSPRPSGEMRGFHVVFKLRMQDSGELIFWDDDGSIIRCNGEIVHEDRECHPLARHQLSVRAGDCLEIAHWQHYGDWIWAGHVEGRGGSEETLETFCQYLPKVQNALRRSNGPSLKMYIAGNAPARSVLCLYSMILNGYHPSAVHIFGEYQWHDQARELLGTLLPFARVVPTGEVRDNIAALRPELADASTCSWTIMKPCVSLLCPPHEFCYFDDDIFILDSVQDAIAEFKKYNLVYAPDADYSKDYRAIWGLNHEPHALPTGNLNAGFYWLRNTHDRAHIAARLLTPQSTAQPWQWEQGFMATEFAHETACALSAQRYFYPYFDGLPGGITGYDYARNPCGFASVHFGGLAEKPSESVSRMLAAQILNRRTAQGVR